MERYLILGGNCPRRQLDAQRICNYLEINSLKAASKAAKADIIVVNTCGAFNNTEKQSLLTIRRILKEKSPKSEVIITGCLIGINPSSLSPFRATQIIPYQDLHELDSVINASISLDDIPEAGVVGNIPSLYGRSPLAWRLVQQFDLHPAFICRVFNHMKESVLSNGSQGIYSIMVSRGCLGNCSYCAIKIAHGSVKSKLIATIVEEIKKGLQIGYHVFTLDGEDVGCFGMDRNTSIVSLFKEVFSINGDYRIIVKDINPRWFIRYFDKLMPIIEKISDKIHDLRLPIQSGSNRILKLMRRHYSVEDVRGCLLELKKRFRALQIHTQVMVGFPGETEEDFEATYDFLREIKFSCVVLFAYQDRFMTEAYQMSDKVPPKVIRKRVRKMGRFANWIYN